MFNLMALFVAMCHKKCPKIMEQHIPAVLLQILGLYFYTTAPPSISDAQGPHTYY